MKDIFEGRWIDIFFLTQCVKQVLAEGKYVPEVLVLSQNDFAGHVNAITLHGHQHHIVNSYKKLGLKRIVWAEDVKDGEFLLSSGKGLEEGIETILLKD